MLALTVNHSEWRLLGTGCARGTLAVVAQIAALGVSPLKHTLGTVELGLVACRGPPGVLLDQRIKTLAAAGLLWLLFDLGGMNELHGLGMGQLLGRSGCDR